MSERPLTERQEKVLVSLLATKTGPQAHYRYPATPNAIACAIGLNGNRARRKKGPWSGPMGPAQRIIGSLNGLRGRKLVATCTRPDGYSGSAYALTEAGEACAVALREAV